MGLRAASVRHPHVVMAPALTETNQSQNFKLSSNAHPQPTSPINGLEDSNVYISRESEFKNDSDDKNAFDNLNTLALASELLKDNCCLGEISKASDNIMNSGSLSMGDQEDKMGKNGLESVSTGLKDKSDVDQLLNNLSPVLPSTDSDVGQNVEEIMQVVLSTMEGAGDRISQPNDLASDADNMFALSNTDLTGNLTAFEKELLNDVDMMSIGMEEPLLDRSKETQAKDTINELKQKQAKMERKLDFLLRRVRKMQVRYMGQHVSGEIAGVFEHVHRTLKKLKDNASLQVDSPQESAKKPKAMSYSSTKSLIRKLEMSTSLQASASSRQRHLPRYFGSGSADQNLARVGMAGITVLPSWQGDCKQELQKIVGSLETELNLAQSEVDSEATVSSSGGESADEMQNYNNPHQQPLSIQKRAIWRYVTDRATIAAHWTWLQAQISDLEFRIRQHNELYRQIRASKPSVQLGGDSPPRIVPSPPPSAVNGYRGQLPGVPPVTKVADGSANGVLQNHPDVQCARTRPLVSFRKRKLLQLNGLHVVSKKAARPSTVRCGCVAPLFCALCTGRTDPTHPRDLTENLSKAERIALVDPCFHPVFSMPEDVSMNVHFEAIMKTADWQQRSSRSNLKAIKVPPKLDKNVLPLEHRPKKLEQRRRYNRLLKSGTVNALSAKIKKMRGRKPGKHSLHRISKKRHNAKMAIAQLQALSTDGIDEELETIGSNTSSVPKLDSPSSSPVLPMGGYKRNRITSYDIDNIVIPYSVAASTRVEKLQYKEILTPKWRIIDPDFASKCGIKDNEARNPSQESDGEDLSEDAVALRHEKCEHDEKKKFLSYLKLPLGYGRSRSHKRTDSRTESSGGNTPDPMSPHAGDHLENLNSPLTSPPATPMAPGMDDSTPLPSVSVMRRRTISQSRWVKERELYKEDNRCSTPEHVEVAPYEKRVFPLSNEMYDKMLKHMPENHQFHTNIRAQDSQNLNSPESYFDYKMDSVDSESTESALGDEDPNDPEWMDMEGIRERHKR